MSKYTTELRYICEDYAGLDHSEGYYKVADIIDQSRDKVFDFDYPIFDASYKNVLETKILKHFYLREICAETVGVWKHFLDMRMNEIMPYYNKLYQSELIEFNPLYDVDLTRDYNKDGKGTGNVADVLEEINQRLVNEEESIERDFSKDLTDNETHTGTIKDTGTVKDTGTIDNEGTVREAGTIDNDGTVREAGTIDNEGTVKDTGTVTDTGTVKDTGNVQYTGTVGKTGSDDTDTTVSGTDGDIKKNTRWDVYSDTPQGGLTNVENETYLTNARKIIDDGTGSLRTINNTTNADRDYSETETRNLTDTNNLTKTNDLTKTNNLTRTDDLQETRDITRTDDLQETRDLTRTDDLQESRNLTRTDDLTNTRDLADAKAVHEVDNDDTTRNSETTDNATKNSTNTKTRNLRDIEDYIEHIKGKTGGVSFSKLLQEFRETFLNIDMMIINDLNDLFFGLW